MNMVKKGMTFLFAMASFTVIRAQTADEIVHKYIDALGGKIGRASCRERV